MRTDVRQKVALLYPGNPHEREGIVTATNRFAKLFEALVTAGIPAKPVIWHDDVADEVKAQLMGVPFRRGLTFEHDSTRGWRKLCFTPPSSQRTT